MRRLRPHIAPAGWAQPRHHVPEKMSRRGDLVPLLLRHVEPETGQCRIEFPVGSCPSSQLRGLAYRHPSAGGNS
jgi:hypothetical protein